LKSNGNFIILALFPHLFCTANQPIFDWSDFWCFVQPINEIREWYQSKYCGGDYHKHWLNKLAIDGSCATIKSTKLVAEIMSQLLPIRNVSELCNV
jgi:hypothetical protein